MRGSSRNATLWSKVPATKPPEPWSELRCVNFPMRGEHARAKRLHSPSARGVSYADGRQEMIQIRPLGRAGAGCSYGWAPNPSIERTPSSQLRRLAVTAHVEANPLLAMGLF